MSMVISSVGLAFIKRWEAFVPYVYDDLVKAKIVKGKRVYVEWKGGPVIGTLTIGYGHTAAAKAQVPLVPGTVITEAQGSAILDIDLDPCEACVNNLVKVPLTQGQFDALVSLVFNMGEGNFRKSTLLRRLNAKDYDGARAAFDLYNRSKGQVIQGLRNRRDGEQKLWDMPDQVASRHAFAAVMPDPDMVEDHPAEIDQPQKKSLLKSTEVAADVAKAGVGTGAVLKGAAEAGNDPSLVDKAIEAKAKAEALGVDVTPISLFDWVGPWLQNPWVWGGAAVILLAAFGIYRRWRRLEDEL